MRLVWLNLRHFRRFQDAQVNLDAPVIALVGPNEAGKSTLLEAIVAVGRSGEFNPRDITRNLPAQGRVLEATFLLDEDGGGGLHRGSGRNALEAILVDRATGAGPL